MKEEELTKSLFDIYWKYPEKLAMFYYYRDRYYYLHPKFFVQMIEDYLVDVEDVEQALKDLIDGETEDFFNTIVQDSVHC